MTSNSEQRLRNLRTLWTRDRWIRPFIAQYKRALATSLGLGVLATLFAIGLMFTSGFLISDAAEQPALGLFSLLVPLGLVQVFGVGKPFLSYLERLSSHDWVFKITSHLRRKLFSTIERQGVLWSAAHRAGDALGLLAEDIDHVQNLYIRSVFPATVACIVSLLVAAAFGVCTPVFGLGLLLGLGMLLFAVPLASALGNAARKARFQEASHELYACTLDQVSGLADWNFAQRKDDFTARVSAAAERADREDARFNASVRAHTLATNLVFTLICVAVLLWAAAHFAHAPQDIAASGVANRPADWLAAFVIGFFPLLEVLSPLPEASARALDHLDAIDRLNTLDANQPLDEPNAQQGTFAPQKPYDVKLSNASFSYPSGALPALKNINLSIGEGQKVAILGPSGSGKSTLLLMLRGDIAPDEPGRATLGGADVRASKDAICPYVNVVQQSSYLFDQTLMENLALGDASITEEQAVQALRRVNLGDLLDQLPQGLDTVIGEAGFRFSGGQRQRIAFARILLRQAPIVLLDEPMSGLDPRTEKALLNEMLDLLHDRTVIMVTHHLMGIERMDRVIFMDKGEIALDGSPDELARSSEHFRTLLSFDHGAISGIAASELT